MYGYLSGVSHSVTLEVIRLYWLIPLSFSYISNAGVGQGWKRFSPFASQSQKHRPISLVAFSLFKPTFFVIFALVIQAGPFASYYVCLPEGSISQCFTRLYWLISLSFSYSSNAGARQGWKRFSPFASQSQKHRPISLVAFSLFKPTFFVIFALVI